MIKISFFLTVLIGTIFASLVSAEELIESATLKSYVDGDENVPPSPSPTGKEESPSAGDSDITCTPWFSLFALKFCRWW